MATYGKADTDAMLKAAESGQAGVRDQAARDQQESQFSRQMAQRQGESLAQTAHQGMQLDEQKRSNVAREGLAEREMAERSRSNRMQEAIEQDKQDIEAADRGVQRQGPSRADALREDPEEQAANERFQRQANKPLEVPTGSRATVGGVVQTEERKQADAQKRTAASLNAQANYYNALQNIAESRLKGDEAGVKAGLEEAANRLRTTSKLFDAGKNNKLSDADWVKIQNTLGDNPDPAVQQELQSKTFGPALGRLMQTEIDTKVMSYIAADGTLPPGDLIDFASPVVQRFTQESSLVQQYLKQMDVGGILSKSLNIRSLAEKNKQVRRTAASLIVNDKSLANSVAGGQQDPMPSQGGPSARPPAPGDRRRTNPEYQSGTPVQQRLQQQEQRAIEEQQRRDEQRRRGPTPYRPPEPRRNSRST